MTDTVLQPAPSLRQRLQAHPGPAILALLLLLVLAWGAWKAVRTAWATRAVVTELRALQATDLGSLSSLDPAQVRILRDRFANMENDLGTIRTEVGFLLPLGRFLGWLPGVGYEAQVAPELLELAGGMATAGRAAMDGALPTLEVLRGEGAGSMTARLLVALEKAAPLWQQAGQGLDQAAEARAKLEVESLHPSLAEPMRKLDETLPDLRAAIGLATLAQNLLGADEPHTYLLLAQNNDELRPTGGFISGAGRVTVDRGEIGEIAFQDGSSVFNTQVDHPPAPPELERYMQAQMLLLRDANWSPDFPTVAAVAQALYLLDMGIATDGVVAFDVEFTRRLVIAMGSLALPGYDQPVTEHNLVTALRAVWDAPYRAGDTSAQPSGQWSQHRKDFMQDLALGARAKLDAGEVDLAKLAWALLSSLREKHLLVNLADSSVMSLLAEAGWDGAVRPGQQDYLMVVDSNVGWNKVNQMIRRDTAYRVSLSGAGDAQATLELVYHHGGQAGEQPCLHLSRYGDSYEDMVRRCYFDFVRVYAPPGAALIAADGFEPDTVQVLPGERGTTVFAGFLVVPPGESRQVRITYRLPGQVVQETTYRLLVQKQAGVPAWPMTAALASNSGSWQSLSPEGQPVTGGLGYAVELSSDRQLVARWIP